MSEVEKVLTEQQESNLIEFLMECSRDGNDDIVVEFLGYEFRNISNLKEEINDVIAQMPEDVLVGFYEEYEDKINSNDFEGTGMSEADVRNLTVEEMNKLGIYD